MLYPTIDRTSKPPSNRHVHPSSLSRMCRRDKRALSSCNYDGPIHPAWKRQLVSTCGPMPAPPSSQLIKRVQMQGFRPVFDCRKPCTAKLDELLQLTPFTTSYTTEYATILARIRLQKRPPLDNLVDFQDPLTLTWGTATTLDLCEAENTH